MDWIAISVDGRCWRGAAAAVDLAIPLDFQGAQPRFFAGVPASSVPLEAGSFNGEVRRGASCNCVIHTFAPHCHGTHTECVGHLTDDGHSLADHAPEPVRLALLVTMPPDTREISHAVLATAAERWKACPGRRSSSALCRMTRRSVTVTIKGRHQRPGSCPKASAG
jgi:hypothetical protein